MYVLQCCAGKILTHLMNLSAKLTTYLSMSFYALALVLVSSILFLSLYPNLFYTAVGLKLTINYTMINFASSEGGTRAASRLRLVLVFVCIH
jgi:hypothetical protein